MAILLTTLLQVTDTNGNPYAFATAYFYDGNTTTPAAIYAVYDDTDDTLPNPLTADEKGLFPSVFLDKNITYRMVMIEQGGSLLDPLLDVFPCNQLLSVGAADLEDGAIEAKLGYTPVDPANAVFTAPARMTFAGEVVDLHEDDVGFRQFRLSIKDTSFTLALDDSARLLIKDDTSTPTYTIPPNTDVDFPVGTWFEVTNQNTGAITIARGTGVTLRIAGSATDQDVSLAQWGRIRITQIQANKWQAQGTGAT